MTPNLLHLLAESDSSDTAIKIIFGVIVAVIWIVGGIMSSMKKKGAQTQEYAQQDWNHLLRDLTGGQSQPWNPNNPSPTMPPPIPQQPPRQQQYPSVRPFAQQSPRPFVQQYRQPAPRPAPRRQPTASRIPPKPFKAPKPIQRRPQAQRRQQPGVMAVAEEQPHGGIVTDATVTMGQLGGAAPVQNTTVTTRSSAPRITRSQLGKLVIWSEVLAPPLAIREIPPR